MNYLQVDTFPELPGDYPTMVEMRKKQKIFLIEDAARIRAILIDILQQTGEIVVVGHAESQGEALQQLRSLAWDIAIVDIGLREGNGLGVLAGLQNDAKPYGKRIVFTANPSIELAARSLALGACQLFDKSSDMDRLVQYIQADQGVVPEVNC